MAGFVEQLDEEACEERLERVAAIDVAKASGPQRSQMVSNWLTGREPGGSVGVRDGKGASRR